MDTAPPGLLCQAQTCTRMQVTILTLLLLAQYGALAAPLGALESSVAQDGLNLPSLGAPRTFDLFYPKLPSSGRLTVETSTAVPVIHLPEDKEMESPGKAGADAYLDMFPQDLLDSNRRVKPIDVRIIEHDGFIDYEIEFVELSEEQMNEYNGDSLIDTEHDNTDTSDKSQDDSATVEVTTQKIATTLPFSTSAELTAVTFVDLLKRARKKHRQKLSLKNERNPEGTTPFSLVTPKSVTRPSSTDPTLNTSTEKTKHKFQRRNRIRTENRASPRNMVKQRKRVSQLVLDNLGNVAPIKTLRLAQRFKKTGRSTTLKPATVQVQTSMSSNLNKRQENQQEDSKTNDVTKNVGKVEALVETPVNLILSSTTMSSSGENPGTGQPSDQVSGSSLKSPTENISELDVTSMMTPVIHQTTEHPGLEITTTLSLIEELKRQLITISYDLSQVQSTDEEDNHSTTQKAQIRQNVLDSVYEFDDLDISESRSVVNLHTSDKTDTTTEQIVENITAGTDEVVTEITTTDEETTPDIAFTESPDDSQSVTTAAPDVEYSTVVQTVATEENSVQPERSPKRINGKGDISQVVESSTSLKGLKESQTISPDDVVKGQYHEVSPGQYHETHPGQYHEVNPGQYHETNPGQYHETNPGQYNEKHPGQDLGVDNLTVNFDHTDESRVYNVKANAGDFIIGEVGRIDINSGQTVEGVRYTAVEGEVDPATISDLLAKYFGARTS